MSYIPLPTSFYKYKLILDKKKKQKKIEKVPFIVNLEEKYKKLLVPSIQKGPSPSPFFHINSVKNYREDPIHMLKLRNKFIKTAKECLGIPYGRKYLELHPEYNKGIFLDCCGLIRYIVNKLSKDFGFRLAGWNQNYQYDMLPKEIKFDEMKPGDLIFYSGIYYPDRAKKQQTHNMVHVEIYLGEGEKTIGSRESNGVVSIYDTFQFSSENYFNIKYHFKSIDTWLKGTLKSFCKYHQWEKREISTANDNSQSNNNRLSASFVTSSLFYQQTEQITTLFLNQKVEKRKIKFLIN